MKSKLTLWFALTVLLLLLLHVRLIVADSQSPPRPAVTIVRLDPRFNSVIPPDAVVEKLADGFAWVEGPVWNRKENFLLFSDIPNNAIFKWREGNSTRAFLKPSGYAGSTPFPGREPGSNGLAFDPSGRLVLCEHGVLYIAPDAHAKR